MEKDNFSEYGSDKSHVAGFIERTLRKFRNLGMILVFLFVALICSFCIGLAFAAARFSYDTMTAIANNYLAQGMAFSFSFIVYSLSLMIVCSLVNRILFLPQLVKPFNGNSHSIESIPWYLHNGLLYIVRYSCLEFFTPSPISVLFYKAMGMKIGKGVVINTTNISDACLITLGDFVTIGGSAHLLAHYSQRGQLVLATLEIGNKSTIGLKATVFGAVKIGEKCLVRPHSVILPKTIMLDGDRN